MTSEPIIRNSDVRDIQGRFVKGVHSHPTTEFKKGEHWRERKPFWDKGWLYTEYVEKSRIASDIAKEFNLDIHAIYFWLKKHNIPKKTISETRKLKYWGSIGDKNGMYGVRGEYHPSWKGGISPERQEFYASAEWAEAARLVYNRDNFHCKRCEGVYTPKNPHHIHHKIPFIFKEYRLVLTNLVLVCQDCHNFIHSKKNVRREFIESC